MGSQTRHTFCDVGSRQSKAWKPADRPILLASSAAELVALRLPARGQWPLEVLQYERIAEDRLDDVGRQQCQPQDPAHYDCLPHAPRRSQ